MLDQLDGSEPQERRERYGGQIGAAPPERPDPSAYIPPEVAGHHRQSTAVEARLQSAHHRAALTLRYLDGLPVPEVASHLDRTVHATEALLVRARAAFRRIYEGEEGSR